MKTIKFRAWDKKYKKWLLGYEMPNLGGFSLFGETVLFGDWGTVLNEYLFNKNGKTMDDLVVMQFTGLFDKDGKEIYEGDIFDEELIDSDTGIAYSYPYVCFENGMFTDEVGDESLWDIITGIDGKVRYKVIGNIYENPELIASKK